MVEFNPIDAGTKINAGDLGAKAAEELTKNKNVTNSVFEGIKDIKTGANPNLDINYATAEKQGFFSKMKGVGSKAWSGIKSIPSKIASKFKSGASTSANSGSKLAGAKNWIKGMGGKIQNGLKAAPSKVGRFFKGKGGKWALVGLAVAAATAAGVGIYKAVKSNSEPKTQEPEGTNKSENPKTQTKPTEEPTKTEEPPEDDPVEDEEPTDKPAKTDKKPADKTSSGKKTGSTTGAAAAATTGSAEEPDKTDKTDKAETTPPRAATGTDEETPEVPTVHKVVKGDNVWNIAKKHLQNVNGKKPTNAEILKHTKELMEINGLEFKPDGKCVLIRPNDELKLIA